MAIDSTDKNRAWATRRWTWVRRRPRADFTTGMLVGLMLLGGGASCTKGGAPDTNGCPKVGDLVPGNSGAPPARTNYAVLKSTGDASIYVPLDSAGSGTYTFTQCDQQDTYTVDSAVLVDKQGDKLATATHNLSGGYSVAYTSDKRVVMATGMNFVNLTTQFSDSTNSPALTVQGITAGATMANQGDPLTVTVDLSGSPCAVHDSQWWLTAASVTTNVTAMQTIAGGSGSVTLRIPPTVAPGIYYVAGQVTLSSGRVLQVKRLQASDANYTLVNAKGTASPVMLGVPVVSVTVAAKADVDTTAPGVAGISVSPAAPVRCAMLNLTLHLTDNQPLGAAQQVKVWLGKADNPKLVSATVVGSEYLSGTVQLPIDAPSGVWYAWPEVIRDAAGNEAVATFLPDGTFALSGQDAMAKPTAAASFTLASSGTELPDAGTVKFDLAMPVDFGAQPDMAVPLPAVLTGVSVTGRPTMVGAPPVSVYVTWTDSAHPQP